MDFNALRRDAPPQPLAFRSRVSYGFNNGDGALDKVQRGS